MTITAICNQKGGVGKTTATLGLAQTLAGLGRSVLIVDADPQANSTLSLGVTPNPDDLTLLDVMAADRSLAGVAVAQALVEAGPGWAGVHIIPSERALADREIDNRAGREIALKTALAGVKSSYDHILIDCPPSLGLLTVNALTAADQILIVTESRETSLIGVQEMLATVGNVREYYNPALILAGIVVNKWLPGRVDRTGWLEQARDAFGAHLLAAMIPEREIIARAATQHRPIPIEPATADILAAFAVIAGQLETTIQPILEGALA